MLYIYLKVTIETFSKLRFSKSKKLVYRFVFRELWLMQISFNFKTYSFNLKIRRLGIKPCVAFFFFFFFERNYDVLKSKSPCILLNKNINFNKIPHTVLERRALCFSSYKNRKLKAVMSYIAKLWCKNSAFLYRLYFIRREFF